jgi:prenyltransferase beta subunit
VGLKLLLAGLVALVFAVPAAAGIREGAAYLRAQQNADGGFGDPGRASAVDLTCWAVLGLRSTGRQPARKAAAADYLVGRSDATVTALELRLLALAALGRGVGTLARRVEEKRAPNGRIGPTVNSTMWGILALRAAGRPAGRSTVRFLLRQQRANGGWGWAPGHGHDSNDTAVAIQALRATGRPAGMRAIRRGLAYLRRKQNANGGFELTEGRGSDAQSTAWAIQAFIAARRNPGRAAFRYLARLQRRNGSFRYNARHAVTPVWVTAQVLPALARRPFPLR